MRRISAKTAALAKEHGPMRREFVDTMACCALCGVVEGLSAHEMTPGANRLRAFGKREALLAVCWHCNSEDLKDAALWPLARQLWLKLQTDPEHFNLAVINAILAPEGHPNPPQRVTAADVVEAGRRHLMGAS